MEVLTDWGVQYFRLASLKQQLKLESLGMKSSGGVIRPRIAKEFNLPARASHQQFIDAVQAKMDSLKPGG